MGTRTEARRTGHHSVRVIDPGLGGGRCETRRQVSRHSACLWGSRVGNPAGSIDVLSFATWPCGRPRPRASAAETRHLDPHSLCPEPWPWPATRETRIHCAATVEPAI